MNKIFEILSVENIKRIKFRDDITGLRAIAVLAVVFYHAEYEFLKGGWLGVDIFFVISGYLISNIIISELNEGTFTFKRFYTRRVKRIIPALFTMLLLTIPFSYFLLNPKNLYEYSQSLLGSIFFYANYFFDSLEPYNAAPAKLMPLLHTWSLAIEEQFYILFPLLTIILYRYFKKYFGFIILIILSSSFLLNATTVSFSKFYRLEYRMWELLLGVLVMIIQQNLQIKHLEKIGIVLMSAPLFYFDDSWVNDIEPKFVALMGVAFIILSNKKDQILFKVLDNKSLKFIGLSSYSIYLFHQPIFVFSRYTEFYKYKVQLLIFCLIVGWISYKFIELRFLNKVTKIFKFILVITPILIIFCVISFNTRGDIYRDLAFYYEKNGYIISDEEITMLIDDGNYKCVYESRSCVIVVDDDYQDIVLVGDSSVSALGRGFAYKILNEEIEYNYIENTFPGCPFLVDIYVTNWCDYSTQEKRINELKNIKNSYVIMYANYQDYFQETGFKISEKIQRDWGEPGFGQYRKNGGEDKLITIEEFELSLVKTVEFFTNNNNQVLLFYPNPIPITDPKVYYQQNGTYITYSYSVWEDYTKPVFNVIDNIFLNNLTKINLNSEFCSQDCVFGDGEELKFQDAVHVGIRYSIYLSTLIIENYIDS